MKKYKFSFILPVVFITIGMILWQTSDHIFYLYNFLYISSLLGLGFFFNAKKMKTGRLIVQFGIGLYLLLYLGIYGRENMQIEGFWYYLFLGVFQAAAIHYAVAKIFGPLLFGRGWCSYACWTAAVLDLLPYKTPRKWDVKRRGFVRYFLFILSFCFVGSLFLLKVGNINEIMYASFIVGNILYYAIGIILAFDLKDNRAFCKYICPITVFLKPASYFAKIRVTVDENECINCGKCLKACPMEVDMLNNKRNRKNGTECILCMSCIYECPKEALRL